MGDLILKPKREKSLLRRHPWVFSGAIQDVKGDPASGETVNLLSSKGDFLARAAYSSHSQIRARIWTFDPDEEVNANFFRRRLQRAIAVRDTMKIHQASNAYRLVHAESDGLPGLIVDRYDGLLVMQVLSTGPEFWKEMIADILLEETGLSAIYERSDADVRSIEGLLPVKGVLRGSLPESSIKISEHGLDFVLKYTDGHKTGLYLDQRENHLKVRNLAQGRDVLDCFCYSGGFTLNALVGGAKSVQALDSSGDALEWGKEHVSLNGLQAEGVEWREGDVFHELRRFRDENRSYDLIVLDPPKFAPTAAGARKASRGYKDINLLAIKLLRSDGILVTFSCSGGVEPSLFQKIVASAALDAGADVQIVERLTQASDHPVALNFPEGEYLKGLICNKNA